MGTVKGVLIGTAKGIGFLAYGTLKIGFLAIKTSYSFIPVCITAVSDTDSCRYTRLGKGKKGE